MFADSTTPEATRSAPTQTLCRSHRYSSNSANEMQSDYLVLPTRNIYLVWRKLPVQSGPSRNATVAPTPLSTTPPN
ncbi:MAG: hypothetical protein GX768_10285 [Chloroflexi bacterium]|nr:hypothetical protein [Chloroflexota bacterium]